MYYSKPIEYCIIWRNAVRRTAFRWTDSRAILVTKTKTKTKKVVFYKTKIKTKTNSNQKNENEIKTKMTERKTNKN